MWCIPKVTPEFEKRLLDICSLYEQPLNPRQPVVCFDEKNHQLLSTPHGSLAAKPKSQPRRTDYEYQREGVRNEFVIIEPKAGWRHIRSTNHRTGRDWAKMIKFIATKRYPNATKIHLIEDNLNTHNPKYLTEVYGEEEARKLLTRIKFHPTPTHASWLNQAEIEIGIFFRQVLNKRLASDSELKREKDAYLKERNKNKALITWSFTVQKAQEKFKISSGIKE